MPIDKTPETGASHTALERHKDEAVNTPLVQDLLRRIAAGEKVTAKSRFVFFKGGIPLERKTNNQSRPERVLPIKDVTEEFLREFFAGEVPDTCYHLGASNKHGGEILDSWGAIQASPGQRLASLNPRKRRKRRQKPPEGGG